MTTTDRPYFTPSECAALLTQAGIPKITPAYIRGEIRDGLLTAEIINRPIRYGRTRSKRIIRVYPDHWRTYIATYWPLFLDRLTSPAA